MQEYNTDEIRGHKKSFHALAVAAAGSSPNTAASAILLNGRMDGGVCREQHRSRSEVQLTLCLLSVTALVRGAAE